MSRLWTVQEVADYLGIPVKTIYQWHTKQYGPEGRHIGKYLRFRPEDVIGWVDSVGDRVA